VAKVEEYRGFIFATLNGDASSLADHLGDIRRLIDLLVDKAPHGLEVVTGFSRYTFKGNWKMQAENGVDGWHVGATHLSYVLTIKNRAAQEDTVRAMDVSGLGMGESGFLLFHRGIACCGATGPTLKIARILPIMKTIKRNLVRRGRNGC